MFCDVDDSFCGGPGETPVRPVRLNSGTSSADGLLESCISVNGYRAGVCYEDIDAQTANLVCRKLGFSTDSPGININC